MLVLERFDGESIMIGDDVVVKILSVVDMQVRIGIAAPRSIPVNREEVWLRLLRVKKDQASELLPQQKDQPKVPLSKSPTMRRER